MDQIVLDEKMVIVKYKLIENENHQEKNTPDFIDNGGYFYSPTDDTLIGVVASVDSISNNATVITKEDLIKRQLDIHNQTPFLKDQSVNSPDAEPEVMTEEEIISHIDTWYNEFVNTSQ